MASSQSRADRKYELHRKLYNNLKDNLTQLEFEDLKDLCKSRYIKPGQLERIKTVTQLLDALEKKAVIGIEIGYDVLKKLLTDSGLESKSLVNDILETEEKMREIDEGDTEEVFPAPEQKPRPSSLYRNDYMKRRRISDPGDVPAHIKRKRFSSGRTESDADPDNVYPSAPDHQNMLLIIDQFTEDREGGQVDREALVDLFQNTLRFSDILLYKDLNKHKFQNALSAAVSRIQNSPVQYDRLFVAILGHGDEKGIKTCLDPKQQEPEAYMSTEEIIAPFKSVKLPKMAGKPKVFLIQACQGKKSMDGIEKDCEVGQKKLDNRQGRLTTDLGGPTRPNDADFLICNSTTENHVSYRHCDDGSWFIQKLVNVFEAKYRKDHVMDMVTEVTNEVSKLEAGTPEGEPSHSHTFEPKKQVPCQISTLTSKILLTSGNN